jgi:hypothetical protein
MDLICFVNLVLQCWANVQLRHVNFYMPLLSKLAFFKFILIIFGWCYLLSKLLPHCVLKRFCEISEGRATLSEAHPQFRLFSVCTF